MRQIRKGRIIGLFGERGSGLAMLALDDDRRGKRLIPCEKNPASRGFDEAFGPGFIIGGVTLDNSVIAGELIYYTVDSVGVLETFTPFDRAPIDMVEEYERTTAKEPRQAGDIGFVEPDDPRIPKATTAPETPKARYGGPGTCTDLGLAPPDDPVYTRGPIVAGRAIFQPHRKWTAEDRERNFQIARDAMARSNKRPHGDN